MVRDEVAAAAWNFAGWQDISKPEAAGFLAKGVTLGEGLFLRYVQRHMEPALQEQAERLVAKIRLELKKPSFNAAEQRLLAIWAFHDRSRALFATLAGYASSQGRQIEVTGAGATQFLCGVHGQYAKASSTRIPAAMCIPQERFESAALFGDSTFAGFLSGLVAFIQRAPTPWRVLHAEARPAARIADVVQRMMRCSNFHISFHMCFCY